MAFPRDSFMIRGHSFTLKITQYINKYYTNKMVSYFAIIFSVYILILNIFHLLFKVVSQNL